MTPPTWTSIQARALTASVTLLHVLSQLPLADVLLAADRPVLIVR